MDMDKHGWEACGIGIFVALIEADEFCVLRPPSPFILSPEERK
jgi:hypothetical protein